MTIAERFVRRPGAWVGITDDDPNPHELVELVGNTISGAACFDITELRASALDSSLVIPDEYHLPFPKTIFEYATGSDIRDSSQGGLRAPLYQATDKRDGIAHKVEVSRIGVALIDVDDEPLRGCIVADFEPNMMGDTRGGVELIGVVERGSHSQLEQLAGNPAIVLAGEKLNTGVGFWILRPMGQLLMSINDDVYPAKLADEFLRLWFLPVKHVLGLLSCKNITTERVLPSRQQRRAAERRGHTSVSEYRIVVKVPGKTTHTIAGPRRPGEPVMPAHMVRGHFAEYGADKPLFGKYTGRFWIPAHVRGKREEGQSVTPKDYVVVPAEATP